MDVADRLRTAGTDLTVTERRIAEVVLRSPQTVAFGTVAQVAAAADAGTATVVRLAIKLGYDGFVALQRSVQDELAGRLGPAAERIRTLHDESGDQDFRRRHSAAEQHNLERTFDLLDPVAVTAVVALLGDSKRPVLVVSGSASRGVAHQFVHDLGHLRPGVQLLDGNQVDVLDAIALTDRSTIVVAIDLRRYDKWLVAALDAIVSRELDVIAVSDSVLSPLAAKAGQSLVVSAESIGPFDSHVGTLAVLNLIVVEVAHAHRGAASKRLDRLEIAWTTGDALTD